MTQKNYHIGVLQDLKSAIRKAWGLDAEIEKEEICNALNAAIKALEQEPKTNNDCISRSRAIERLKLNFPISQGADNSRDRHRYMQALADIQAIREMPSVTPQEPKTGHWIETDEWRETVDGFEQWGYFRKCNKCGYVFKFLEIDNYCPNCGRRMVEPQESEG